MREELREPIRFRVQNLLQGDPPGSGFDMIFCRNVMIYFDKPTQKRLVDETFARVLRPDGYLFIGHSESLTGASERFRYVREYRMPIYRLAGADLEAAGEQEPVMIRVMVVDDSPLVRKIASDILSKEEDIQVVSTAASAEFALQKLDRDRPDVITMDMEMPGMGGLAGIREIMSRRPIPVMVLCAHAQEGAPADPAGPGQRGRGFRAQAHRQPVRRDRRGGRGSWWRRCRQASRITPVGAGRGRQAG